MIYYYIISSLIAPIASSLNEVNELKGWPWHTSQLIDRILLVNLGASIIAFRGMEWMAATSLFLSGVAFWIIYDLILSLYGYRGYDSANIFDRYSYLKFPLLAVLICLNLIKVA